MGEDGSISRVKKDSETRKQEIFEAAELLFLKNGYEFVTIEEILKLINLSKGGFYHHFKSKEEVLMALNDNVVTTIIQEALKIAERTDLNGLQKIQMFVDSQFRLKKPIINLIRYFRDIHQSETFIYRSNLRTWEKYIFPLTKMIEQGKEEGIFQVAFPIETATILMKTIATLNSEYNSVIKDDQTLFRYMISLQHLFTGVLGISRDQLTFVDEEFITLVTEKS